MKTEKIPILKVCLLAAFLSFTAIVYSQTAGTLTFSCNTTAPSGTWGLKHVLAVWIQNTATPSIFIKTKAKYGNQDDHLTSWIAVSNYSVVDATTGSTLTAYGTQSVVWNGTDVNNVVVPDGNYNVYIEMGWGSNKTTQHAVTSFQFTKGQNAQKLSPAATENYTDVVVDWAPKVTMVEAVENSNLVSVFPNPTGGKLKLDFKNPVYSAKLSVENEAGATVFQKSLENGQTGVSDIDLSRFANGLYYINLTTGKQKYVYKVILNK